MSSVSEKRRRIWRCYAALRRLLRRLDIQEPRVPGSLYLLRRKCGKASCRCARGRPHTAWVLTRSERGQSRLYSVPADQHRLLRERTEAYRRYQVARALWVKNAQKLLEQIDAFA